MVQEARSTAQGSTFKTALKRLDPVHLHLVWSQPKMLDTGQYSTLFQNNDLIPRKNSFAHDRRTCCVKPITFYVVGASS